MKYMLEISDFKDIMKENKRQIIYDELQGSKLSSVLGLSDGLFHLLLRLFF